MKIAEHMQLAAAVNLQLRQPKTEPAPKKQLSPAAQAAMVLRTLPSGKRQFQRRSALSKAPGAVALSNIPAIYG